jgi:hypothetical protein
LGEHFSKIMSFGSEVKHCEKCGKLMVREDTEMQWFWLERILKCNGFVIIVTSKSKISNFLLFF